LNPTPARLKRIALFAGHASSWKKRARCSALENHGTGAPFSTLNIGNVTRPKKTLIASAAGTRCGKIGWI
jgi:hypothetical protein